MPNLCKRFFLHALECGALQFGQFRLKSGRESPYFFNLGAFSDGAGLELLGECCAALVRHVRDVGGLQFDLLFGAAYKGIPLASVTALTLHREGLNLPWAFNRKEPKLHGEGGAMIGADVAGKRILLIDDVLTAGTAVRATLDLLRRADAIAVALVVLLDRCEYGTGKFAAACELRDEYGLPVFALGSAEDFLPLLSDQAQRQALRDRLADLRIPRGSWLMSRDVP